MEQNIPNQRQGVSAALAAAQARAAVAAAVHFPGEDSGRSLADMAQRDLDAALQLLADRAQYITGASGAAIALRRNGRDDMLCRASVGSNAPELGALLSTEFGLSGESVRTRQLLRCDDAERDARVNREVCRQMGIASVLVMPVVNDDQVLGVFELFSGKANAFGERDLSAVQRLSEMVETAVQLAHATENLPEQLSQRESSVAEAIHPEVFEGQFLGDLVVEESKEPHDLQSVETIAASALESPVAGPVPRVPDVDPKAILATPQTQAAVSAAPSAPMPATASPAKKLLFWSAATDGDAPKSGNADQSHVPPVLRGLRKCEACGFPISAGRVLCVECEEKKWRGQLRPQNSSHKPLTGVTAPPTSGGGSFAAAAASMAKSPSQTQSPADPGPKVGFAPASPDARPDESMQATTSALGGQVSRNVAETPELVLSAGLEPQRSWFSANKYILLALLAIGASVAAFLALR